MPSFDLISKLDMSELKNVVQMAQKQISGRYDFKGSKCTVSLINNEKELEIIAEDDYKIRAALDIFRTNMAKRKLGMKSLEVLDAKPSGNQMMKQIILLKSGIDKETGKLINKIIKGSGMKITSQYLDEKVRITGKKIDDLQTIFQKLRNDDQVKVDLTMENMK